MKTKKFMKRHLAGKMFAIAAVMMMGVAFTACSSNEEPKPGSDAEYVDLNLPQRHKVGSVQSRCHETRGIWRLLRLGRNQGQDIFLLGKLHMDAEGKSQLEVYNQVHLR